MYDATKPVDNTQISNNVFKAKDNTKEMKDIKKRK